MIQSETDLCGHKQQQKSSVGCWHNNYDCGLSKASISPLALRVWGLFFLNRIFRGYNRLPGKRKWSLIADICVSGRYQNSRTQLRRDAAMTESPVTEAH